MPENANSVSSDMAKHNSRTNETLRDLIRLLAQSVAKAIAQPQPDMVKPIDDRQ